MTCRGIIIIGKGLQKSLLTVGRHAGKSGHVGITKSSVKIPICHFEEAGIVVVAFCGVVAFLAGAKTFDARLRTVVNGRGVIE
jgi:hypothetical protein